MPMVYFAALIVWVVSGILIGRVIGRVCAAGNGGPR
jgi:hypothetical protein